MNPLLREIIIRYVSDHLDVFLDYLYDALTRADNSDITILYSKIHDYIQDDNIDIALLLLTVKSPNKIVFYEVVKSRMSKIYDKEEVNSILKGLEI